LGTDGKKTARCSGVWCGGGCGTFEKRAGSVGVTKKEGSRVSFGVAGISGISGISEISGFSGFSADVGGVGSSGVAEIVGGTERAGMSSLLGVEEV
jgi:hypothetical protein